MCMHVCVCMCLCVCVCVCVVVVNDLKFITIVHQYNYAQEHIHCTYVYNGPGLADIILDPIHY